jgi:hypothetical protein
MAAVGRYATVGWLRIILFKNIGNTKQKIISVINGTVLLYSNQFSKPTTLATTTFNSERNSIRHEKDKVNFRQKAIENPRRRPHTKYNKPFFEKYIDAARMVENAT